MEAHMSKLLYTREIEDELMIQFIIMYALMGADEPLAYADLVSVVQDNCEINFNDLQLGLDNLELCFRQVKWHNRPSQFQ